MQKFQFNFFFHLNENQAQMMGWYERDSTYVYDYHGFQQSFAMRIDL